MRSIIGSVLLCAAVAATGCAGVSNALRVDRRTPAEVELDATVAATTNPAEYHGSNVKLAAVFAGVATKDARAFETAVLPRTAAFIHACPSGDLFLQVAAWPTPAALVVQLQESCMTRMGKELSDGVRFSAGESTFALDEYQFATDPDAGRYEVDLGARYRELQYAVIEVSPTRIVAPNAMAQTVTSSVLSTVYADERTVEITRSPDHSHDYSMRIQQTSNLHVYEGNYDRGLADIGRLADAYGGHPDGVVTPWEIGRFEQDLPKLAAVFEGKLTDADVLASERARGVRVDEAKRWVSAVAAAAPSWGRVVRDRDDPFGLEF